jgi:hypothetical protein
VQDYVLQAVRFLRNLTTVEPRGDSSGLPDISFLASFPPYLNTTADLFHSSGRPLTDPTKKARSKSARLDRTGEPGSELDGTGGPVGNRAAQPPGDGERSDP